MGLDSVIKDAAVAAGHAFAAVAGRGLIAAAKEAGGAFGVAARREMERAAPRASSPRGAAAQPRAKAARPAGGRKCGVAGCSRPLRSAGYCAAHYQAARRGNWPMRCQPGFVAPTKGEGAATAPPKKAPPPPAAPRQQSVPGSSEALQGRITDRLRTHASPLAASALAEILDSDGGAVLYALKKLVGAGRVRREGERRFAKYAIVPSAPSPTPAEPVAPAPEQAPPPPAAPLNGAPMAQA